MSKFKKKTKADTNIPTSALPDIIFMLLFFFMVATTMRERTPEVSTEFPVSSPSSTDLIKDKNSLKFIYVGFLGDSKDQKIQLNDKVYNDELRVPDFIQSEMNNVDEEKKDDIRIALKVDEKVEIGFVAKIEDQIRLANRYKILYSTVKSNEEMERDMTGL